MARTTVIVGTATAASRAVSGSMAGHAQQPQEEHAAEAAAVDPQAKIHELKSQMDEMQAQQLQIAAAATSAPPEEANVDIMTQL